ncbi:MAG: hypothetical protein O2904_04580 [bacterium]|nr:hypothetical protein [bacterium]
MKRFLTLATAAALSLVIATPSFAYYAGTVERISRRSTMGRALSENKLSNTISEQNRTRDISTVEMTGRSLLRRAEGRMFRRYNRTPKLGSDRYRILNTRVNKRTLRRSVRSSSLDLPVLLVQTGGNGTRIDRPSRRSIRGDRDL